MCSPVPVVRLIVAGADGRVLLLHRSAAEGIEGWCLPGGKIDRGETVEAAAARELLEETGLRLTGCRFLFYQDNLPPHAGGVHYLNLYLECETEGDLVLNAESIDCAWVAPADLADYTLVFRNDLGVMRYWTERGTG